MHRMRRTLERVATHIVRWVAGRQLASRPCKAATAHQVHMNMIDRLAAVFIAIYHYTIAIIGKTHLTCQFGGNER